MKTHFPALFYARRVTSQLVCLVSVSDVKLSSSREVRHATCQSVVRVVNPDRDNRRNASAHADANTNHLTLGRANGNVPTRGIVCLATTRHDSAHECSAQSFRDRPSR